MPNEALGALGGYPPTPSTSSILYEALKELATRQADAYRGNPLGAAVGDVGRVAASVPSSILSLAEQAGGLMTAGATGNPMLPPGPAQRADEWVYEGMSPAAKAYALLGTPENALGKAAGLTAFLALPTKERIAAHASRIKERAPTLSEEAAKALATRSAVGEAAQRYRIGMKRARGDEGLGEAVGAMGLATGKMGSAAHPFTYGIPGIATRQETITPKEWNSAIEKMAKYGMPPESVSNYTLRDQSYMDSVLGTRTGQMEAAGIPPITSAEALRHAGSGGYGSMHPELAPLPMSTARAVETSPAQVAVEDIPLLLDAISRAAKGEDIGAASRARAIKAFQEENKK